MSSKIVAAILFVKQLKLLCTCPTRHDLFFQFPLNFNMGEESYLGSQVGMNPSSLHHIVQLLESLLCKHQEHLCHVFYHQCHRVDEPPTLSKLKASPPVLSTGAQYVTLDNKIKCLIQLFFFLANPANKTVTRTAYTWELLIANHLDQSL